MTPQAAANRLEVSVSTLYRYEAGQVAMKGRDVVDLCELYEASEDLTKALKALAGETNAKGWWQSYGDVIPTWFQVYVGLESAASQLRQFEPDLIPGLLQTHDYATAVLRLDDAATTEEEIAKRVKVRLERQNLLYRRIPPAPQLDVILGEVALRRSLDDRGAMAEQLRHVVEASSLPNVSVRVLPLDVGLHRAANIGSFTILDFPSNGNGRVTEPTTVYSDSLTGSLYLDKPTEVKAYSSVWTEISGLALDETQSRKLITEMAEGSGND